MRLYMAVTNDRYELPCATKIIGRPKTGKSYTRLL